METNENVDLVQEFKVTHLNDENKKLLLDFLGFTIDADNLVVDKSNNKRVICPYSNKYVHLSNASVMPGSTIIINTSPYTLSCYISEFLKGENLNGGS